jgi:membrane protease YdiL (CAAX protease family)
MKHSTGFISSKYIFIWMVILTLIKSNFLHRAFKYFGWGMITSELMSSFIHNTLVVIAAWFLIRFYNIEENAGIGKWKTKYLSAYILPFLIVMVAGYSNISKYVDLGLVTSTLFLCSCLAVGMAEEFMFRGFLQSTLLQKHSLKEAVLITSIAFGLIHLLNLKNSLEAWADIINQVFIAISIGVIFSALVLKTGNLWLAGLLHGGINFVFSVNKWWRFKMNIIEDAMSDQDNVISYIITYGLFLLLFIIGWFMVNRLPEKIFPLEPENK